MGRIFTVVHSDVLGFVHTDIRGTVVLEEAGTAGHDNHIHFGDNLRGEHPGGGGEHHTDN